MMVHKLEKNLLLMSQESEILKSLLLSLKRVDHENFLIYFTTENKLSTFSEGLKELEDKHLALSLTLENQIDVMPAKAGIQFKTNQTEDYQILENESEELKQSIFDIYINFLKQIETSQNTDRSKIQKGVDYALSELSQFKSNIDELHRTHQLGRYAELEKNCIAAKSMKHHLIDFYDHLRKRSFNYSEIFIKLRQTYENLLNKKQDKVDLYLILKRYKEQLASFSRKIFRNQNILLDIVDFEGYSEQIQTLTEKSNLFDYISPQKFTMFPYPDQSRLRDLTDAELNKLESIKQEHLDEIAKLKQDGIEIDTVIKMNNR